MPGLSKVIVLDADVRASRQVQLGFEREGVPTAVVAADRAALELPGDDAGLLVIGGVDGEALELVRRARTALDDRNIDAPIVFAGRGVGRSEVEAAGADEVVRQPAYLRDVVTIGRLLRGVPAHQRAHLVGNLVEITGVFTLVRALATLGRSATLTLIRGLRRGEIRFYHGEVTSAQVGMIHGQAALHQLLLWTDARFDFRHEDVVRRQQIPLPHAELFADAERFLEGVRDSSGGLSPSVVLEQDLQRVQALGKQIPTEVYGVLRMFDGHRVLADALEDSPYRVFETLRVAQRAVDAGLLRPVDHQPVRAAWRATTAIDEWLVGSGGRDRVVDSGPIAAAASEPSRDAMPAPRDARTPSGRKPRRKKKRRLDTPPVPRAGASPAKAEIDWGALVPRVVGAEVSPLSGVVPAAHVSGEIIAAPAVADDPLAPQPKVMFEQVVDELRLDDTKPERVLGRRRISDEEVATDETSPTSAVAGEVAVEVEVSEASTARIAAAPDAAVHDVVASEVSNATTERIMAAPAASAFDPGPSESAEPQLIAPPSAEPQPIAPPSAEPQLIAPPSAEPQLIAPPSAEPQLIAPPSAEPQLIAPHSAEPELIAPQSAEPQLLALHSAEPQLLGPRSAEPAGSVAAAPASAEAAPAVIDDDPSDGVIRDHIASADTAPVKRSRLPSDPPEDDRPEVTAGEITLPRARPIVDRAPSEPSILVSDLAAVHLAVSEIASDQVTVPSADAASPALDAEISQLRSDAVAFNEIEEAFFRAGHEKEAVVATTATVESFEDLDEGYQPVGFWERLRGKPPSPDPVAPTAPGIATAPDANAPTAPATATASDPVAPTAPAIATASDAVAPTAPAIATAPDANAPTAPAIATAPDANAPATPRRPPDANAPTAPAIATAPDANAPATPRPTPDVPGDASATPDASPDAARDASATPDASPSTTKRGP